MVSFSQITAFFSGAEDSVAFLGVDIGSETTRAALIDEDLHMIALARSKTCVDGTIRAPLESLSEAVQRALDQVNYRVGTIDASCFSIPGIVDNEAGVAFAPTLEWCETVPVREIAMERLQVPLALANDADAAAMGEAHYGAGIPYDRFALVRMGSLTEVSMVIDGRAYVSEDLPAQIATEGDFLLEAYELIDPDADDGFDLSGVGLGRIRSSQVMEEARRGTKIAMNAVNWLVDTMTDGIVRATARLEPEAVIIAGVHDRDCRYLARLVTRRLAETRSGIAGIPVECASLGNEAKAFGAAVIAMQNA